MQSVAEVPMSIDCMTSGLFSARNIPLGFVLTGDILYTLGHLSGETVNSSLGISVVVVSTIVSLWLRFKRDYRELLREQDVKDREARRIQDDKDLQLLCNVEEAHVLLEKIEGLAKKVETLEMENRRLKSEK